MIQYILKIYFLGIFLIEYSRISKICLENLREPQNSVEEYQISYKQSIEKQILRNYHLSD